MSWVRYAKTSPKSENKPLKKASERVVLQTNKAKTNPLRPCAGDSARYTAADGLDMGNTMALDRWGDCAYSLVVAEMASTSC